MSYDYAVLDSWDGESPAPWDKRIKLDNHESSVSKEEVLRLTKEGVGLLQRQPLKAIQDTKDKELRKAWDDIQRGKDRLCLIRVWKGIHQRYSKPHITARVVGGATLHLWLSTTDTNLTTMPGTFTYRVVSVSATERGGMVPATVVRGIRRRGSVNYDVMSNERRRLAAELEFQEEANRLGAIDL